MTLRAALCVVLVSVMAGCVSSGGSNPLSTDKGRDAARQAYVQLGLGYLQQGLAEQAKIPLGKALELDKRDPDTLAALALLYQSEMEPELAENSYRQSLSARAQDARTLNNYGSFLFEQQRYQEAFAQFQKAAADNLYPERSRVYENLGITALKLGQPEVARQHLETLRKYAGQLERTDAQQAAAMQRMNALANGGAQAAARAAFESRKGGAASPTTASAGRQAASQAEGESK